MCVDLSLSLRWLTRLLKSPPEALLCDRNVIQPLCVWNWKAKQNRDFPTISLLVHPGSRPGCLFVCFLLLLFCFLLLFLFLFLLLVAVVLRLFVCFVFVCLSLLFLFVFCFILFLLLFTFSSCLTRRKTPSYLLTPFLYHMKQTNGSCNHCCVRPDHCYRPHQTNCKWRVLTVPSLIRFTSPIPFQLLELLFLFHPDSLCWSCRCLSSRHLWTWSCLWPRVSGFNPVRLCWGTGEVRWSPYFPTSLSQTRRV